MKIKLLVLLMIPACLLTFIGGVRDTSAVELQPTEEAEVTVVDATQPTEECTIAPTTEPIIPETTYETKPPVTEPPVTKPPVTEPPVTEPPTTEPPVTKPEVTEPNTEPEEHNNGLRSLGTFKLTAYCSCQKCCGSYALNRPVDENGNVIVYGSIGVRLESGVSIAVDPRMIPYGTQVVINGHTYTAHDTGGNIKGNRIDVYFDNHKEAWDFGTQYAEVFIYVASD